MMYASSERPQVGDTVRPDGGMEREVVALDPHRNLVWVRSDDGYDGMSGFPAGLFTLVRRGVVAPEPVSRVVTGCRDCPFFEEQGYYCNRAAKYGTAQDEDQRVIQAGRSPSWCPLRTAPVLVSLRVP